MLFREQGEKPSHTEEFRVLKNYAKRTLGEIIYDDLKDKITRGSFSPNQRLQEDNLAKDYETSRTPIRDALKKLEQEKIIEKLSYGGYRIREVNVEEIEEIFGIRSVLESYAASLAVERISNEDLKKIEDILGEFQEAINNDDYDAFVELDTAFHACLYNASRSPHLLRILENLWDYFIRYRKDTFLTKQNLKDSLKAHQMIIKKMKAGDKKAVEKLVREHVNKALRNLKKGLKKTT